MLVEHRLAGGHRQVEEEVVVAADEAQHVGDVIAAVAAVNRRIARTAAEAIVVAAIGVAIVVVGVPSDRVNVVTCPSTPSCLVAS